MTTLRERVKRTLPGGLRDAVAAARRSLAAPPLEEIVLHGYDLIEDPVMTPRLSLVIPTVAPAKAFGGVTTGLEIMLEIVLRTGAELRIILDDFDRVVDPSIVEKRAAAVGIDPSAVEIVPRTRETPKIGVRASDVFCSFNWWTTLNVRSLLEQQHRAFGGPRRPQIYLIQEYEPGGYPFSSTHMMARMAVGGSWPCWGVFNSGELHAYVEAQGHRVERAFVFEPKLAASLRPFLQGEPPTKARRIVVYGRPSIERNCYPAVAKGLALWADRYPEFADWEVVSAGLPHPPLPLGRNRSLRSLGMLPLEDYALLLRTSAIGLSLMASPHPSYPPLEMAHFGLRTLTNTFAHKDLASSHPNIISMSDVAPETIAEALASACRAFAAEPDLGWRAKSGRPSYLAAGPLGCLDELAEALNREVWVRGS